jgi:hypothetical protein
MTVPVAIPKMLTINDTAERDTNIHLADFDLLRAINRHRVKLIATPAILNNCSIAGDVGVKF